MGSLCRRLPLLQLLLRPDGDRQVVLQLTSSVLGPLAHRRLSLGCRSQWLLDRREVLLLVAFALSPDLLLRLAICAILPRSPRGPAVLRVLARKRLLRELALEVAKFGGLTLTLLLLLAAVGVALQQHHVHVQPHARGVSDRSHLP